MSNRIDTSPDDTVAEDHNLKTETQARWGERRLREGRIQEILEHVRARVCDRCGHRGRICGAASDPVNIFQLDGVIHGISRKDAIGSVAIL
jgi:hypothetical protein